jgi:hypothetical protein
MDYKIENHQSFGDIISWMDFMKGKINGWKFGLKQGDNILCDMQSGKTAKFEIKEINYMKDPEDQFFGEVEFKDYV